MKLKLARYYYLILSLMIISQITVTLYRGGIMLYERTKIKQLKSKTSSLKQTLAQLEQQTHQKYSLNLLLSSPDLNDYVPMHKPLVVTRTQALALGQTNSL